MKIIELFFVNIVFICFPITLYIIFITFKKKFKVGEQNVYLGIMLHFVFIMLMYYYSTYQLNEFILCLTIPILVSFQYNKTSASISLSFIYILYFIFENSSINLLILPLFVLYYTLYYYYMKTTKSKLFLTNYYVLITIIFMIIKAIFYEGINYILVVSIILFISIAYSITLLINKISTLLKTYKTLNDVSIDKELRANVCKISHEIKNPLVVIKGYLEVLDSASIVKSKKALLNEVNYALAILSDFKDLNHLKIEKEEFILNEIIMELKNEIIPFYSDKMVKCRCVCGSNLKIYADKKRIKQVLINIVKNSVESIDDNGKINIHAYIKNNNMIIKIKDNGKGMDKDTLDNLFTPFYTKKVCGTGLGLCLSKEIIKEHNGTIEYCSEVHKYTEVKIVLPISSKDCMAVHNKQVLVYKD